MGDMEHVWSLDEQGRLIIPVAARRDLGWGPETGLTVGTLGRYLLLWEPDRETPLRAHPAGPMQRELLRRLEVMRDDDALLILEVLDRIAGP